jgi:hypothetical protein
LSDSSGGGGEGCGTEELEELSREELSEEEDSEGVRATGDSEEKSMT